jgi:hypothetical protein
VLALSLRRRDFELQKVCKKMRLSLKTGIASMMMLVIAVSAVAADSIVRTAGESSNTATGSSTIENRRAAAACQPNATKNCTLPSTSAPPAQSNSTLVTVINGTAIEQLPFAEGLAHLELTGYSWRYFRLPTPEKNDALDVVANIRENSCKGLMVTVTFESYLPRVLPQELAAPKATRTSSSSTTFAQMVLPLMLQNNLLCTVRPELGISVKDSGDKEDWYVLVQTRGGSDLTAGIRCRIGLYYHRQSASSLSNKMTVTILTGVGFILLYALFYLRPILHRASTIHVQPPPWTIGMVIIFIPRMIGVTLIAIGAGIHKKAKQTIAERRRRSREAQRDTGRGQRGHGPDDHLGKNEIEDGSPPNEMVEVSPSADLTGGNDDDETRPMNDGINYSTDVLGSSDDDGDLCRICKEDDSEEALVSPCDCIGSVRFIHKSCLNRWRISAMHRNPRFTTHCEICSGRFREGIDREALTNVILGKALMLVLLVIVSYFMAVFSYGVVYLTFSQATCAAAYHDVSSRSVLGVAAVVIGLAAYLCFCVAAHIALSVVWCAYLSTPAIIAGIQTQGVIPPFFTQSTAVTATCFSLFSLLTAALFGFIAKVIVYHSSQRMVWNWEVDLVVGGLMFVFVVVVISLLFVIRIVYRARRLDGLMEEHQEPVAAGTLDEEEHTATGDNGLRDTAEEVVAADLHAVTVESFELDTPDRRVEGGYRSAVVESGAAASNSESTTARPAESARSDATASTPDETEPTERCSSARRMSRSPVMDSVQPPRGSRDRHEPDLE